MIEKPLIPLAQFREEEPETVKVFDAILQGLVKKYWKAGTGLRELFVGLEGTIEGFEGLIDAGLLKLGTDPEEEEFFLLIYDLDTDSYKRVGEEYGTD